MDTEQGLEDQLISRAPLYKHSLIYGVLSTCMIVLSSIAISSFVEGNRGAIFPLIFLGIISFAVLYEFISSLRDLRSIPMETKGEIKRMWKKSRFLLLGRQDYLLLDRKILEIKTATAMMLDVGDNISIQHWPKTLKVIKLEKVASNQ